MNYEFIINLKSDLCASSGESLGSLIDTEVCYDENGIPFIPSKRIKGILKEAVIEYCDWSKEDEKYLYTIFGKEGERNPGKLKIDNAYISEYEKIVNELKKLPINLERYTSVQRMINTFTYTRYQTAIDDKTGTSKDNSLRSTRVVKKGNTFIANIEIDGETEEIELLKNATSLVTHMGMNRTRGYGEISCELRDSKKSENDTESHDEIELPYDDETEIEIKLYIEANSEIMVSKQNSEFSKNYIPGSNILGCFAKKYIEDKNITDFNNLTEEYVNLFLNGNVKYSNAYITDKIEKDGKKNEFYPIPFSYAKVKDSENEFYNKILFEDQNKNNENIQLSGITEKFVTLDENNYMKEVKMSENYHHQRPKDKSIGRVVKGENGGTLYQYTVIDRNQYFISNITGKAKYLKCLSKFLNINSVLRIGKSKNTEYGKIVLRDIKINKKDNTEKEYKNFAVLLVSDVILINPETASTTTDKKFFENKIKSILGQNIELQKAFINYEKISGYNILWNLPKEQLEAFKAGSIFKFTSKEPIKCKTSYYIGQKQNEGYGNIKIIELNSTNPKIELKDSELQLERKELKEISNKTLSLLKKCVENTIYDDIKEDAINTISGVHNLNNTTIGRVLLMLQQSKSFEGFLKSVNDIKNEDKLKNLGKILQNRKKNLLNLVAVKDLSNINYLILEDMNQCQEFEGKKIYIDDESYEKYMLEYIKQCLIQIKIEGGN